MRSRNECGEGVVWELYDLVTVDVDCVMCLQTATYNYIVCLMHVCILNIENFYFYCSHVTGYHCIFTFYWGLPGYSVFVIYYLIF